MGDQTRTRKRVLVVDDDPGLLSAVATCLRIGGYGVTTARDGQEALSRVAEAMPDLVISDVRMPRLDGYALARRLRDSPQTALIPIILLTAYSGSAEGDESSCPSVEGYLLKPFEPDQLLTAVANTLGQRQ